MAKRRTSRGSSVAMKAVPTRRTLVLVESGLLLGLAEGILEDLIKGIHVSNYLKALILMVGVLGAFAMAIRLIEPLVSGTLRAVSKLDSGQGAMTRVGLHAIILFLIFVGYVRIFFAP